MIILPIPVEGKYIFAVEEALNYMISNDSFYYLDYMLFYNVPVRDAIRKDGLRAVADALLEYAHGNEQVKMKLYGIVSKYGDNMQLADFDIQILPVTVKMNFYGKTVTYKDIIDCTEITRRIGRWTSERERKNNALHVANIYEPYPCFDSYDYASETRSYDTHIIRDKKITEDDCLEIEKSGHGYHYNYASDYVPSKYLPLVYRNGDSRFVLVVTAKDNPQITVEELSKR